MKTFDTPVAFKPSFKEGEQVEIRILNPQQVHYASDPHWTHPVKHDECPICRDYPQLSHKAKNIPVFEPDQDPTVDIPKHMMSVHETSPLYNAKYIRLQGEL